MLLGDFKQEISRINNKVNMEIFGHGLLAQRVEVFQDKVSIVGNNARVSVLGLVDPVDPDVAGRMDRALIRLFKQRFEEEVVKQLGIKPIAHLKDYDPQIELSASMVVFERPIDEIIKGL